MEEQKRAKSKVFKVLTSQLTVDGIGHNSHQNNKYKENKRHFDSGVCEYPRDFEAYKNRASCLCHRNQ